MTSRTRLRVLLVGLSLSASGCNTERLARLEKENRDISAKLEAVTKAENLDLQEKCAHQASSVFEEMGWKKRPLAAYANHYHQRLNKCFIEISSMNAPSVSMSVHDAFEGKEYAEYLWISTQGKRYWEVKPVTCKVTLLSGDETTCTSQKEFEQLIEVYMDQ
jgi:hypothetical protein